jgi:transposase
MKKREYPQLIQESLSELQTLEKKQTNSRLLLRVQFLRLLKSQQVTQVKQAALLLGISAKHGNDLWQRYLEKGLQGYLTLDYKPRQAKLKGRDLQQFLQQAQSGFLSQQEARDYLQQEFDVAYSQQGISALFQRLKIKAKVPRPSNVEADKQAQSAYKKVCRALCRQELLLSR